MKIKMNKNKNKLVDYREVELLLRESCAAKVCAAHLKPNATGVINKK
jgi:hypothetical protein